MLYIQDTADAVLTRKSDNFKIATGTTQTVGIKQSVDEETVKGGIGNSAQFTIKSNKELEINIKDALFDFQWLAATQGVKVEDDQTVKATMVETVEVEAGGKVTISDTSFSGDAVVVDTMGNNLTGDLASGVATIVGLEENVGKNAKVIYEKDVTGKKIAIRADRFAEKYKCQLYTVAYEQETEAISHDVYIFFDNVTPSAEFDLSLEAGSALAPEITLRATADAKTKEIGSYLLVEKK